MAWTYSNWITLTGDARLAQLRLHIQEVSDAITASTTSNGETYNPQVLSEYLDRLLKQEQAISANRGSLFFAPTRRSD